METSVQKTIDNDTRLQFRYSMLARILSGYNNDYFRSKPFRFFARLYTFLLATMFTVIVLMQYDRIYVYMLLVSHVQFLMNYLVSMMTGDRYFFDYCSKIREIGIKKKLHLPLNHPISRLFFTLSVCVKQPLFLIIIIPTMSGFMYFRDWIFFITAAFQRTSLNISHIAQLQIFEISYRSMKNLKVFLWKNLNYRCGQNKMRRDISIIKEFKASYKYLFENLQTTYVPVKILVSM